MHPLQFDAAVVGAGPAGSAAAYFLVHAGLRVALLDKADFPRDKTCGDGLTPRALSVLEGMGILPEVEQQAFRCSGVTIRNSDEVTYRLGLSRPGYPLQHILVLQRITLDEILRAHAVRAGAVFIPHARVENVDEGNDRVTISIGGGRTVDCKMTVIATGAQTGLLRNLGLLKQPPRPILAARAYFDHVEGMDDSIVLFFDGVRRPGYGWVFPTSTQGANIGCGAFLESPISQASHLRRLIETHPHLRRILKDARQVGPIKGHPLRTDFHPSLSGKGRVLVVGEALGLVNPITGEGIDYALESAELAAEAIAESTARSFNPHAIQSRYRRALKRKFSTLFAFSRLIQRVYMRDGILDRALERIRHKPHLQRLVVEACYGAANPFSAFSPHTVWDLLMPR
jgi:geranylgeranyl reductase family protein